MKHLPKFLVAPGVTRPATAEDQPYLDRLYPLIDAAAREDPGEENEPPTKEQP